MADFSGEQRVQRAVEEIGEQRGEEETAQVDDAAKFPVQDRLKMKIADDQKRAEAKTQVEYIADVEPHLPYVHMLTDVMQAMTSW